MKISLARILALSQVAVSVAVAANSPEPATDAVNQLGLDLYRQLGKASPAANICLSPYSIQCAFAMAHAGASGETRAEMARVLHYPKDAHALQQSFERLRKAWDTAVENSEVGASAKKESGGRADPISFRMANGLFGQTGYPFRKEFLRTVEKDYLAPLEELDFAGNPKAATAKINDWVEEQTRKRIKDLIPSGSLTDATRLVLVNAIHLKAPWSDDFHPQATRDLAFRLASGKSVNVPTMLNEGRYGYVRGRNFSAITMRYMGGELQFLILLPDAAGSLALLEPVLTREMLAACRQVKAQHVVLYLPKFKIEPATMALGKEMQKLGMKTAFDVPAKSADFDGMAPRTTMDYMYISDVFHKTFLAVDEHGTEAAAATTILGVAAGGATTPPRPYIVRVDRPFFFAIQHVASGTCLFMGRVMDPR